MLLWLGLCGHYVAILGVGFVWKKSVGTVSYRLVSFSLIWLSFSSQLCYSLEDIQLLIGRPAEQTKSADWCSNSQVSPCVRYNPLQLQLFVQFCIVLFGFLFHHNFVEGVESTLTQLKNGIVARSEPDWCGIAGLEAVVNNAHRLNRMKASISRAPTEAEPIRHRRVYNCINSTRLSCVYQTEDGFFRSISFSTTFLGRRIHFVF